MFVTYDEDGDDIGSALNECPAVMMILGIKFVMREEIEADAL